MVNKTDAIEIITYAEEKGITIWVARGRFVCHLLSKVKQVKTLKMKS